MPTTEELLQQVYHVFNQRDIDTALQFMTPDVHWPNGWEGGYVDGREAVSAYWTRQWQAIDPYVTPLSIKQENDGRINVQVQQLVKDKSGNILFEGQVHHIYTLKNGLIKTMEIEK